MPDLNKGEYEDTLALVKRSLPDLRASYTGTGSRPLHARTTFHDLAAGLPGLPPVASEEETLVALYNLVSAGQLHLAHMRLWLNEAGTNAAGFTGCLEHSVTHYECMAKTIERRMAQIRASTDTAQS